MSEASISMILLTLEMMAQDRTIKLHLVRLTYVRDRIKYCCRQSRNTGSPALLLLAVSRFHQAAAKCKAVRTLLTWLVFSQLTSQLLYYIADDPFCACAPLYSNFASDLHRLRLRLSATALLQQIMLYLAEAINLSHQCSKENTF